MYPSLVCCNNFSSKVVIIPLAFRFKQMHFMWICFVFRSCLHCSHCDTGLPFFLISNNSLFVWLHLDERCPYSEPRVIRTKRKLTKWYNYALLLYILYKQISFPCHPQKWYTPYFIYKQLQICSCYDLLLRLLFFFKSLVSKKAKNYHVAFQYKQFIYVTMKKTYFFKYLFYY